LGQSAQHLLPLPGGISAYLTGNLLDQYALVGVNLAIYLLIGAWLFDVPVANVPAFLAILALTSGAIAGLGLAGASTFNLLNAKRWGSNPGEWLMGLAVTLLAGVYSPPSVLPETLQHLSEWLPQTHALRAARLVLAGQATLLDPAIAPDHIWLVLFAAATLPMGGCPSPGGCAKGSARGR
jgi:ABC-type multidrug transport system permease subunit